MAKLAGVPDSVIDRAKEIVEELIANDITAGTRKLVVDNSSRKKKKN